MTKAKGLQGCEVRGSPRIKARGNPRVKARGNPGVKARGNPGVKARRSPGVTSHTLGSVKSVREYEGVNPHTPKATPILRDGVQGFPKLHRTISGVKTQWLVAFFISLESS
jgi:hypothetical protein